MKEVKKNKHGSFVFNFIGLCIMLSICSGSSEGQDIARIRNLFENINRMIKSGRTETIFFIMKDTVWTRSDSAQLHAVGQVAGETAKVYMLAKKIVKTVIRVQSPSGDWSNIAEYYFYESGRTAFVFQRHETYQAYDFEKQSILPPGPYVVEKRIYFDQAGKEIRKLDKAYVASSGKALRLEFVHQIDLDIYERASSLPFFVLIGSS